ncbi:MAG: hypothetical protein HYS13_21455 [Planctomycetia bacterium]|nr:hypothetical protein [Planctomycetia bacterium]
MLQKLRVAAVPDDDACEAMAQKFNVSRRQARADLRRLLRRLEEEGARAGRGKQGAVAVALAVAIKRRERIFQDMMKAGDVKLALEAEKDRCRLWTLYDQAGAEEEDHGHEYDPIIRSELDRLARAYQAEAALGAASANGQPDAAGAGD